MDILQVENIKAGYGNSVIINDINFSMREGELTALLGLNGAGKTTLLKVISGLLKPIDGKCIVNGRDIYELQEKERAKHISYMPQRNSIIYDTQVIDVVLMGITPYLGVFDSPTKAHRALAYEMLKLVGMEYYLNENFLHLSEGQKQLIIISRSLMQNAEIMLFDEPDSALDFKNKHMVLSKIKEVVTKEKRGGIITLHDPNFALSYCDRIIILEQGKLFTQFKTKGVDKDFLCEVFMNIYGNIDVIKHKNKYIIVRL
ncbi:iron complex transport system ATP-binding protein [Proteiniborus ethanoligenes]|uniref:Iron complex transport system ATP-binding protein n=1 Tax=Proteiniborus ethanoligenes TaxID=415015 RepID=A0A1H3QHK4_9FIRM|nr:ABC transporter ATP-binding protein [Proteiniborus ethanoligenes]SDZ12508.1 iron complex transport system ATP-binding protein [Proteiniborus ethanoligenes]